MVRARLYRHRGCVALRAKIASYEAHPSDEELSVGTPDFHPIDEDLSLGAPDFRRNPEGWDPAPHAVDVGTT
jgi:hypothetical protein